MSHRVSPCLTVYVLLAGAVVVSRFCVTVAFFVPELLLSLFLNSIDFVWYGAYYSNSIFAITSTP